MIALLEIHTLYSKNLLLLVSALCVGEICTRSQDSQIRRSTSSIPSFPKFFDRDNPLRSARA